MPYSELLLPVALATPLCTSLILLMVGRFFGRHLQSAVVAVGFAAPAIVAAIVWVKFAALADSATGYAGATALPLGIPALGISLALGVNSISLPLFVLAGIVGLAAGLHALRGDVPRRHIYLGLLLFMLAGAVGMFVSADVFFLYFFHEAALIPAFILILQWGDIGRRTAAIQMAVYHTVGAMLVLAGIVLLALKSGAASFSLPALKTALAASPLHADVACWVFGLLLFGFGILAALFPFHSWAPAAYTEAPTPVSMLHAGVLKTFGIYGLLQLGALLAPAGLARWAPVLFWLALASIIVLGLVTMSQRNLKEMLAHSTVPQTGLCFLGVFAVSLGDPRTGPAAAVLLLFAHGLAIAALFALSHNVWQRTGTLEFVENGGLAKRAPVLALFFVAATLANIGLPGFANFWGELGVFASLGRLPAWQILLAATGLLIPAICMLRAVAALFWGKKNEALKTPDAAIHDMTWTERVTAGLLLATSVAVGFFPNLFAAPR